MTAFVSEESVVFIRPIGGKFLKNNYFIFIYYFYYLFLFIILLKSIILTKNEENILL